MSEQQIQSPIVGADEANDREMYFSVSPLKLVIMSICTFGIYELYWYYKNWCLVKKRNMLYIMPFWRAFFAYFFCYSLFKRMRDTSESQKSKKSIAAGPLATGWIVTTILWKLPDPYWLVTYFAVLFILPIQLVVNEINQIASPKHRHNRNFTGWNLAGILIGGPLFLLLLIGTLIQLK